MSLSGALNTAVSGLQAQSRGLGHISDNIANASTVGYKRIDTRFQTLVTLSTQQIHQPGGVRAVPFRATDLQGTITGSTQVTNLAVTGSGFFSVSKVRGESEGLPTFETDPLYSRAGDFNIDKNGYLVNTGGYFLNGWEVSETNSSRVVDRTSLAPIRISQLRDAPSPTTEIDYSANLPSGVSEDQDINPLTISTKPALNEIIAGDPIQLSPSQIRVFDALGASHSLDLQFIKPTALIGQGPNTDPIRKIGEVNQGAAPTDPDFINEQVWYADLSGDDFSFAVTPGTAALPVDTSVAKIRYRFEFYPKDDPSLGTLAGSLRSIREEQSQAAASLAVNALKNASFDGTNFANVGGGATNLGGGIMLTASTGADAPGAFGAGDVRNVSIDDTVSPPTMTLEVGGANGGIYTGPIPIDANGQVNGDIVLSDPLTPTKQFTLRFTHDGTNIDPWDINGKPVLGAIGGIASLPFKVAFADPGADLNFADPAAAPPEEVLQDVDLNFGRYGRADGLTQFTGEQIDFEKVSQNGVPPGSFRDLSIDKQGFITINYDNGRRKTFFQVPLAVFDNPNGLQLEAGNAFQATFFSGEPALTNPGGSGAGDIAASSVEGSNTDIAEEFSKLIVTQRIYSANSRIITTSNDLLEETVNLVR
jgi:flagellar hook protein FlgE